MYQPSILKQLLAPRQFLCHTVGTNDRILFSESSGDAMKYNVCKELNRVLIIRPVSAKRLPGVERHHNSGPGRALTRTDSFGVGADDISSFSMKEMRPREVK